MPKLATLLPPDVQIVDGKYLSEIYVPRSGIVLYTILKNELYFCFGRDKVTGELTDFGGGVKKPENALSGGLREFREETREIFDLGDDLLDCVGLIDMKIGMAMLFVSVPQSWITEGPRLFAESTAKLVYDDPAFNEISEIVWVSRTQLFSMVHCQKIIGPMEKETKTLWGKVRKFFRKQLGRNVLTQLRKQ